MPDKLCNIFMEYTVMMMKIFEAFPDVKDKIQFAIGLEVDNGDNYYFNIVTNNKNNLILHLEVNNKQFLHINNGDLESFMEKCPKYDSSKKLSAKLHVNKDLVKLLKKDLTMIKSQESIPQLVKFYNEKIKKIEQTLTSILDEYKSVLNK